MTREEWAVLSDGEKLKLIVNATAFCTALRFRGHGNTPDDSELEKWHEHSIRVVRTEYDEDDQRRYVRNAVRRIERKDAEANVVGWHERLVTRMDKRRRKAFLLTPQI